MDEKMIDELRQEIKKDVGKWEGGRVGGGGVQGEVGDWGAGGRVDRAEDVSG